MSYPYTDVFQESDWNQNVYIDKVEFYDDGNLNQNVFNKEIYSFLSRKLFPLKIQQLLQYFEKTDNFKNIVAELNDNTLKLYFQPKSRHFQHFSQNFSTSGSVSFGYEIGLRNLFKSLDKTSLKFDKDLGGGITLDFVQTFPTQNIFQRLTKVDYKMKIGQEQKSKFLSMDQKEIGVCFDDCFELKLLQKRLVFNPLFFQQDYYENFLDQKNFLSLKYLLSSKKFVNNLFHDIHNNLSVEFITNLEDGTDFKINQKLQVKTLLRKLLPLRFITDDYKLFKTEIENTIDLNFLSNFQLDGYSIFNRPFYHNIRGFSSIQFNNPFEEHQSGKLAKFCLSLANSFKINFLHFPIFQNSQVHPFIHNTTLLNYTNRVFLNSSFGLGLKFKMNDMVSLEGMVNFHHYSNQKSQKNIEEVFQLRFSIHDQLILNLQMKTIMQLRKYSKQFFTIQNRKFSQTISKSIYTNIDQQVFNKMDKNIIEEDVLQHIDQYTGDFTCQIKKISSLQRINCNQVPKDKELLKQILQIKEEDEKLFDFIYQYLDLQEKPSMELINILAKQFKKVFIQEQTIKQRKPVITIMGHVDHGKTTLLDYLRSSDVAQQEVGGITQKIGGFSFQTKNGPVSFIDTPGHQLFKKMRETGVICADYVVVILSAVEGIKNQTKEVLDLLKKTKLPFMIALNKIDLPNSDIEAVEEELVDYGINLEPYGGDIVVVPISAKTGENCDLLVEFLVQEADRLGISSDYDNQCELQVIESYSQSDKDKKKASVIVKNGVLRFGSFLVYGNQHIKINQIKNYYGENVEQALPGDIVEIDGFEQLPQSGQILYEIQNQKLCNIYTELQENIEYFKQQELTDNIDNKYGSSNFKIHVANRKEKQKIKKDIKFMESKMRETVQIMVREIFELQKDQSLVHQMDLLHKKQQQLKALSENISLIQKQEAQENAVLIKTADIGTKLAIEECLSKIEDPKFYLISVDCDPVTEEDIVKCQEMKAQIILFATECAKNMKELAHQSEVRIITHDIIYKLIEQLESFQSKKKKVALPFKNNTLGYAKIEKIFNLKSQKQKVCGVQVLKGFIHMGQPIRIIRNDQEIYSDLKIQKIKHFQEDVIELNNEQEGGITFSENEDFKEGDIIECYFNQFKYFKIQRIINGRVNLTSIQIRKRISRIKICIIKTCLIRTIKFTKQSSIVNVIRCIR